MLLVIMMTMMIIMLVMMMMTMPIWVRLLPEKCLHGHHLGRHYDAAASLYWGPNQPTQ